MSKVGTLWRRHWHWFWHRDATVPEEMFKAVRRLVASERFPYLLFRAGVFLLLAALSAAGGIVAALIT